ncbi:MAG: DUF4160 domain-containing protein [Oscillospiraceae bacterium]|nr:DUF4160 domain-containing protein [Oscillospiraceae bacterium]
MPSISMFYGIIIYMYPSEDKRHHTPHIHAKYSGKEAVFSIENGEIIKGDIPVKQANLVKAWMEIHNDELMANWELAVSEKEVYKIDPLK